MRTPTLPRLRPGRVYRTADLGRWDRNATRLVRRLEGKGRLTKLAQGLYASPRRSSFGPVPPSDEAVLGAFLKGTPFVLTGPSLWNRLGLRSTALFADAWVYNTLRTCTLDLGRRRLHLRRVRFPLRPRPEWYVVDLLLHHRAAGMSLAGLEEDLRAALAAGRFSVDRLREAAAEYGTRQTRELVERAARPPGAP
jgi:hypothetical protein